MTPDHFLIDKGPVIIYRLVGEFSAVIVTFSWCSLKCFFFLIEAIPPINLHEFRDSHTKVPFSVKQWLVRVQWSRHGVVSWSLWSRCLIRVLSRSFHRCSIKHNMRCKLKRGPKGQANLRGSGIEHGPLENFEIWGCQRCDFLYFGGKSTRWKKELFMIIKFDSKLNAVSPFKHYHEASQFVSLNLVLYECKF